jgi:hypothetical protein
VHDVATAVVDDKAAAVVATVEAATTDAGANNAVLMDSTAVAAVPLSTAAPAIFATAVAVVTAAVAVVFTNAAAVVRAASVAVVAAVTAVASLAAPDSRADECRRSICSNSFLSFMTATLQCGQRKASRSPT